METRKMKVEWIDTKAGDVYTYIKNGEREERAGEGEGEGEVVEACLVVRESDAGDGLVVATVAANRLPGRQLPQPRLVVRRCWADRTTSARA